MKINSNIRLQQWVVGISSVLLIGKFIAFLLTHSNAILTDALESIVNVLAAMLGLYSLTLSAKPRDLDHPYGHGKIEFISAGIEGSMIVFAGILIIGKSIYNFIHPHDLESLDIGLILVASTGAANYLLGSWCSKQGKETDSLALVSSGKHLQSDAYSTVGILAGLLLIFLTGFVWLDNVIAIVFGIIISVTGIRVARKAVAGIMDEADAKLLKKIISNLNANRKPAWIDLHNMRVIKYGSVLHIDCHLTAPYFFTVDEAHKQMDGVNEVIQKSVSNPVEFFIHTDGCVPPHSCRICSMPDCKVRQTPWEKTVEWDLENALKNVKHGLTS